MWPPTGLVTDVSVVIKMRRDVLRWAMNAHLCVCVCGCVYVKVPFF